MKFLMFSGVQRGKPFEQHRQQLLSSTFALPQSKANSFLRHGGSSQNPLSGGADDVTVFAPKSGSALQSFKANS